MIEAIALAIALFALALAVFVASDALLADRRRVAPRRRVIVNLKGGAAVEGVLLSRRHGLLELGNVTVHSAGGQQAPADGRVLVERQHVEFVQVPPSD